MIDIIQLFSDDDFFFELSSCCSKIDTDVSIINFENRPFLTDHSVQANCVYLVNAEVLQQYFIELEQLSANNAIVYVYNSDADIINNSTYSSIVFSYLPYEISVSQCFNLIHIIGKQRIGSNFSPFLVSESFSEIDQLLSSLSVGLFWKNSKLQYIGCNQKFADDISFTKEEIIGKRDKDLNQDKIALALSENDREILDSGEPVYTVEKEIVFQNGLKKWLRISKFPYRSGNGTILGIVGVYRWFIDHHRKTTDAFSEHNLLQILLDNIPDTIYLKDKDSKFVLVNNSQAKLVGLNSPEELIQKSDFDFFEPEHANQAFLDEQRIIEDGISITKTEYIKIHDGTYKWVNATKLPIRNEKGVIVGTAGISRDIDKMVHTEQSLKSERDMLQIIIDNIPSPIYFKNSKSEITRANQALVDLYGAGSIKDVIGKTDFNFYTKKEAQQFFDEEQKILKIGEPLLNKIESSSLYNENPRWMSTTKIPIKNSAGSFSGIVGISHDITEQILVKQRLEYARQKAEEASCAKSNFLSNMSHEIRTPMNGIIGMAEVLSLSELDEEQKKIVSIIVRSGNNLLNIINDILDFSKIESGKMELDHVLFNMENMFADVIEMMRYHASEKNLAIETRIDKNIPDSIVGDSHRIKQILINLVSNAVKFTEHGTVLLEVIMKGSSENKYWLQFKVSDTGIGMEITDVEKIFESFTQADTSTTRKYGGTGLGLAICNRLVKMMGGKLNVQSKKGEGSVFYFDLMLDKVNVNIHNIL